MLQSDLPSPEPLNLSGPDPLQFKTAEYSNQPGIEKCRQCNQPIIAGYYRLNGVKTCPACIELAKANQLKIGGGFFKAILFGIGGAILGLILYATFAIVTGWIIGYLALAVGYIIAKAMLKGSGGVGDRKLQIAAVLLTYFAVSFAAIPVAIHQLIKEGRAAAIQTQAVDTPNGQIVEVHADGSKAEFSEEMSLASALLGLLIVGIASPFLGLTEGPSGIIGLIILLIGIRIAWQKTKGTELQIAGPFYPVKQES